MLLLAPSPGLTSLQAPPGLPLSSRALCVLLKWSRCRPGGRIYFSLIQRSSPRGLKGEAERRWDGADHGFFQCVTLSISALQLAEEEECSRQGWPATLVSGGEQAKLTAPGQGCTACASCQCAALVSVQMRGWPSAGNSIRTSWVTPGFGAPLSWPPQAAALCWRWPWPHTCHFYFAYYIRILQP